MEENTQPTSDWKKELMIEFDKLQRLFLNGKYHSTQFNKWFSEVALTQARLQERKDTLESVRDIVSATQFKMNVDEYLSLVNKWNRGNFDQAFDFGFEYCRSQAESAIQEEIATSTNNKTI